MRRRSKKGTGIGIISFVVLLLFAIVTYKRLDLNKEYKENKTEITKLEDQIQDQNDRKNDLENKKAYVQTKQYIEDTARDKLGLVNKDDVIFKPEDTEE